MEERRSFSRLSRRSRRSLFAKGSVGRKVLYWMLGIAAALLLLLVLGYYQALAYLQSDSFRTLMESKLSNKGKTERVSFASNLDINGSRLGLEGFEMIRRDALRGITGQNISAEIQRKRLLDGCVVFSKINAESLAIKTDLQKPEQATPATSPTLVTTSQEKADSGKEDASKLKPKRFEIGEIECRDTSFDLVKGEQELLSIQNCSVKATPSTPGALKAWDFQLTGGKATTHLSYLQEFAVKLASASVDANRVRVQRCAIQLTPGVGELRAAGDYSLRDKAWNGLIELTKVELGQLIPETWRERVRGTLFANLRASGRDKQIRTGRGDISVSNAVIEGLPILSELPLGKNASYRTVELETAECSVVFPYSDPQHHIQDAWLFDNINIRAKGDKLRIVGRILVGQNKELAGTLRVGLPESLVGLLNTINPNIVSQIFNSQGDPGFRWLTVNLSGTVDKPVEDLSARLSSSLFTSLPDAAGNAADQAIRNIGGTLAELLTGAGSDDPEELPGESPAAQRTDGAPTQDQPGELMQQPSPADSIINKAADSAVKELQKGLRKLF